MVTDLEHLPPLGHSDHEVLLCSYVCYYDPQIPTHNNQTYDYFRGDYVALSDYFSTIGWDLLFDGNSISLNWNIFKEKIFEGCQNLFPCYQYFTRNQLLHGGQKHYLELYLRKGHCILNTA